MCGEFLYTMKIPFFGVFFLFMDVVFPGTLG